jgi:cytidine deaminase
MLDASDGVNIRCIMFTVLMLRRPMSIALALGFCLISCSSQTVETKVAAQKPILGPETAGNLLSQFSDAARRRLEASLFDERFDGVLQSQIVKDVIRLDGGRKMPEQFMVDMLQVASLYSTPATSGFRVGAVCEAASGNIYFGANLELAGAPLGFTIHAEQSAIDNALVHGEKAVRRLAVTSAPCGHCRQFLNELTTASTLQILIAGKPGTTLISLLPDSFGPADLGVKGGLLGQMEIPLIPLSGTSDALVEAALRAASRSYSPYTRSYSGVALRLKNETIITGSYVENAAYNPSLPPILAAIDRLRFSGRQYSDISGAALVELKDSKISQQEITHLLLTTIAPGIELRVVKARIAKD